MRTKQLATRIAAVAAVAILGATSAFAEIRPSKETRQRMREQAQVRRERAAETRRSDNSRNRIEHRREANRDNRSYRDRRSNRDNRSYRDHRSNRERRSYRDHRSNRDHRSYRHRQPYRAHGRVTNVRRHGHGYRVWVHGARYPFFIPAAHYHRDRFRVGLVINLGGYYNPGGYYDYYDYGRGYSAGALRGVVESVDYRRDTFVIRNEASGSFVTVINRDRRGSIRAGDYVEVYGDWSRSGVFQARDVDRLGYGR